MRRIDLHAHTVVSDGTLTPTQLVRLAAREGLVALAVTDHDHVGGIGEAREEGARVGVEIVAGIELSATHDAGELHVLGYLLDDEDAPLLGRLEAMREGRQQRALRIVARLQEAGVDVSLEDVARQALTAGGSVGRPHVARALMAKGVVASVQQAFDEWLAEGRPAYVARERVTAAEAISLIRHAGGVSVLAHPSTIPQDKREAVVRELAALGLDGVEVEHPKNDDALRALLRSWARELGLVTTGGSDFHGENKPDVLLGSGVSGNVNVAPDVLDALKQRRDARPRAG